MEARRPIKVYCSYAREDREWFERLGRHLAPFKQQGRLTIRDVSAIQVGIEWSKGIEQMLSTSDIILLLISDHYLGSSSCYAEEMVPALEQEKSGKARVIPILLSPVLWRQTPLVTLHILPGNAVPITLWGNIDVALTSIAEEIGRIAEGLLT